MLAPAKINLSLRVEGTRDDGYHQLSGLVAFADVGDEITVSPAKRVTLIIDGPFADELSTTNNLVLDAAHALQRAANSSVGATIRLTKHLPIASGIGGGSSDAAATLTALCELWNISPDLVPIAQQLGADVPMCLHGTGCYVSGIGDEITPLPALPPLYAVLVNPAVALSTATIFQAGFATFSPAVLVPNHGFLDAATLVQWLHQTSNDLTANALAHAPIIGDVLAALDAQDDCSLARMSGSGATCFGLFSTAKQAANAAQQIRTLRPTWWVCATSLR